MEPRLVAGYKRVLRQELCSLRSPGLRGQHTPYRVVSYPDFVTPWGRLWLWPCSWRRTEPSWWWWAPRGSARHPSWGGSTCSSTTINIIIITIVIAIIILINVSIMINIRFLFDKFQHRHKPTVEEMYSRDFVINDCGLRSPFIIVSQANIMWKDCLFNGLWY